MLESPHYVSSIQLNQADSNKTEKCKLASSVPAKFTAFSNPFSMLDVLIASVVFQTNPIMSRP